MRKRSFRRDTSGQVIVITALLVAMVLLSTAVYVISTEKTAPIVAEQNDFFPAYTQALRNTMISALANITSGGNSTVLTTDLDQLNLALTMHSYQAILQTIYTPLNTAPYQNGIWISWAANGQGTSNVYINYAFNSSSASANSNLQDALNVTSQISLTGNYVQGNDNGTLKQVNLTVNLLNEDKPALAQNLTFSYFNVSNWTSVISPSINDFGNGTYNVMFNAQTGQIGGNTICVSVLCEDQRGIFIGANMTCTQAH
jgi:hypothetical protein